MKIQGNIITVGLAPAWDLTCQGNHLDWGDHPVLKNQHLVATGKALNVSRALAWLGQEDFAQMQTHLAQTCPPIRTHMTPVHGATRINVTVLDSAQRKELHLRAPSSLASPIAFDSLEKDLQKSTQPKTVTVLAGALPHASHTNQVLTLARACRQAHDARLVVDSHGWPPF